MPDGVDLLIVGAGIYGAAAAHAASLRGLSVMVVDREDFGAGTSANSLKIAHGGLRYLQSLDVERYLESVRERRRLLRLAPHCVRPQRFRLDLAGRSAGYRSALRLGLLLNELASLHRNRGLPAAQHLHHAPYPEWHDALVVDTERLLLGLLLAARELRPGEVALHNYAPLESLIHEAGRLVGARIGGVGEVRAGAVLWSCGAASGARAALLAMNLIVDPVELGAAPGVAFGFRHPDDGRNVFVVPWRGASMIGTHYRSYPFDRRAPLRFEPSWLDEMLDWIRAAHPGLRDLARARVRFVHAGLLPADEREPGTPADRPSTGWARDGTYQIQGVKWTTAYGVAERAVETVAHALGRGTRAPAACAALGASAPGADPRDPAVLARAVDAELARTLDDVLLRRTGAASAGHPGRALVDATARALQPRLGWSDAERRAQVERFDASFHFAGNVPTDSAPERA
jgi:glycerol-3-phosphate dehydrogenase